MKKRTVAIVLAIGLLVGLLSGCKKENTPPAGYVTRGEWVSMLAEAFGWENYQTDTLAYSDVTAADPLFSSVQAAAGWGVLAVFSDETLEAEKAVTRREVASSAAFAAGFRGDVKDAPAYAAECGIIDLLGAEYLTAEECASAVEAAQAAYLDRPREKSEIAVFSDEVVDLRSLPTQAIHLSDTKAFFAPAISEGITTNENGVATAMIDTGNGDVTLSVGDIFITSPTPEYLGGKAYRITAIEQDSGSGSIAITGETPAIGEIYDELHIHTTVSLDDSTILWADGVTATPTTNELSANGVGYHLELLGSGKHFSGSRQYTWHKEWGNGAEILSSVPFSTLLGQGEEARALKNSQYTYTGTPSIEDFKNSPAEWSKDLTATAKYGAGYKITGDISLSLEVDVDTDYSKYDLLELWPEEASMVVRADILASLNLEGTLSGRLEVGSIPIPIADTGLFVTGGLYIHADATGALKLEVEFKDEEGVGWSHSGGYQQIPGEKSVTPTIQGAIDATFGPGAFLQLEAFKIKIVGAELAIDSNLKASGSVIGKCEESTEDGKTTRHYTESINLSSSFTTPIVNITISGPDHISERFGLMKTFKIDRWAKTFPLTDVEWVFWEATVGEDGKILENEFPGLKVDISPYWGTYQFFATYEGETATPLILAEDGSITGEAGYSWPGGSFSEPLMGSGVAPARMIENDDGSITCVLDDTGETIYTGSEDYSAAGYTTYTIYPPGVPTGDIATASLDNTTRIFYQNAGGGVEYHWYYQPQQAEQSAASFDELWEKLEGTWQFEEYQHRGKSAPYVDHTMEFGYTGDTACIRKNANRDDGHIPDQPLYELVAVDDLHYNAYIYKRGFYEEDGASWSNDVQLVWYSFDLSNLENGELIMGYHMTYSNGYVDNDHIFRYSLT